MDSPGFDTFCPVSDFLPASEVQDPHNLRLWLQINGKFTQNGLTSDMMCALLLCLLCLGLVGSFRTLRILKLTYVHHRFRIPRLINHVSSIMTLEEGDLLLTGTPEGVGPVKNGDKLLAALETADGKELLKWAGIAKDRVGGYKFEGN